MKARPSTLRPRRKSTDRRLLVEQFEDRVLLSTYTVTNNADTGTGSLRDAINQVNSGSGGDLIQFALPNGQTSISPATPLPAITASRVVIDGTTEPGWTAGHPVVELNGSGLPANTPGLVLRGANITVKALVINRFPGAGGDGIQIQSGGGDLIVGCFIGTDTSGSLARPNAKGIFINNVGGNTIGGTTLADRNVISGNTFTAIDLFAGSASRNVIQGNYLGVNASGNAKLGNGGDGVFINSGTANTIGGTAPGAGNVISGNIEGIGLLATGNQGTFIQGNFIGTDSTGKINLGNTFNGITMNGSGANSIGGNGSGGNVISANGRAGIQIQGTTATLNIVRGNSIGVGSDGTTALGNATQGVWNFGGVNNFIGGLTPGDGNIIANNGSLFTNDGVYVNGGSGVLVASNSIYNNAALGIHVDIGSNDGITRPTLTKAETAAGLINLSGSFSGAPLSDYIIQFFGNKTPDASGFGEGRTLIPPSTTQTGISVTTNASGVGTFSVRIPLPAGVVLGDYVTALLHRAALGDTSEFSTNRQITVAPTTDMRVTMSPSTPKPLLQTNFDYNIGVANLGPDDSTGSTTSVTLDPSFTVVSASAPYTINGNVLTFDNGAIPAGATVNYTITVTPTSVTSTNSSATVVSTEIDPGSNNNKATSALTVLPAVNLSISGSTASPTNYVGSPMTYLLSIGNTGPSVAQNVIVTYVVPSNVTFVSADLGSGGLVQTSTDLGTGVVTVTATTPSVPVGPSGNYNLRIVVIPNAVGALSSSFSVAANEQDVNINNNSTKVDVSVIPAIDLFASITPSATTVGTNAPLDYAVKISNAGPSAATGVSASVVLDPSLTFVSADVGGSWNASTHTFTASLPNLGSGTFDSFNIHTTTTISTRVTATVTASNSVEVDPYPSNDTATVNVDVAPSDVAIDGSASPSPSFIDGDLVYNLTVSNNGPYSAANVVLTQILPSSVQFVSSSPGGATIKGTTLTLDLGTIANAGSQVVAIHVKPTVSGPINSTVSVASDQIDPNPSNNSVTLSNVVSPADVSVSTSFGTTSPIILDNSTILVTVTNNGPAAATNVHLLDTLSGSFTIVSATSDLGTAAIVDGSHVSLSIPTLASGEHATLVITVNSSVAAAIASDAVATLDEFDPTTDDLESKASLTYINTPGILALSSSSASVSEDGGSIVFTVVRTKGNLGSATVNYATTDLTAKAGVNYVATSGTLVFNDGEMSKTFSVPIIHDGVITRNLQFGVSLSGSTSAAIGSPAATLVTIVNTDLDLVSPQVVSLVPVLSGKVITSFSIGFSEALEPNSASAVSNYSIFAADKSGVYQPVAVASATYDPSTNKVLVISSAPLAQGTFYRIVVNGTGSNGVQDVWGNVLDGAGNGGHNTNFVGYSAVGTKFAYTDSTGNQVSLKLTGGGSLSVSRYANGDAMLVQLNGLVGRARQVLSGSVKRIAPGASGITRIGSLTGIGTFGDVHVTMTTPPFYVKTISGFSASAVKGLLPKPIAKPATVPAGPRALAGK